jgi:hypothetical protein
MESLGGGGRIGSERTEDGLSESRSRRRGGGGISSMGFLDLTGSLGGKSAPSNSAGVFDDGGGRIPLVCIGRALFVFDLRGGGGTTATRSTFTQSASSDGVKGLDGRCGFGT